MGMDYIPVYEGEDSDDGSVKLSPGKIQRTGVKSEPASRRVIRTLVRAPGTIQLDERRISVISMRAESWVQKVADVTTGTQVKKGQPLMEVYSPAVASAAAEYIATINSPTIGGVERYGRGSRQRLMNLDVPDAAIVAMEKSRTVPITIDWSAPRDGIVLERNAVEGMRAQPGDVLFRVADTSVVWAMIDIAERDLGALAVGQPVAVKARSFVNREFAGKISVIYPQVNRETRTARVRIELSNPMARCFPICMWMRRSTLEAPWRCSPFRKAPFWILAPGRRSSSTKGRGVLNRARSNLVIGVTAMSKFAMASPKASRSLSQPTS